MGSDPWRFACPECGSRMVRRAREGYSCRGCYASGFEPVDLKREDRRPWSGPA